jgi:hypothetical protein
VRSVDVHVELPAEGRRRAAVFQYPHLQTVIPSPIPSGESWPTPSVTHSAQTVSPGVIPSAEAWPTPSVVGNQEISASIPTSEHWPTPFINLEQRILPASIPTGEHWPTPDVALTTDIIPTPIPSGENWPTPTIRGSTQFINASSIPSGESWPTPGITGGNTSLQIWIGGTNVTIYVGGGLSPMGAGTNASASQITSQAIGRATMTLDMVDIGGVLVGASGTFSSPLAMCGLTVIVTELGATLFAGCIDTCAADREMPFKDAPIIVYHITALDKTSICDHRVVTSATYAAGTDVVGDILDVVQNYLNGEGITTQGVPPLGSLGTLDSDLTTNYTSVRNVFDSLATASGTVWWIDPYGVLYFSTLSTLPAAPFPITETAGIRNSAGTAMVQASLSGGGATSGYRNKEYVVSNLNTLPGSGTGGAGSGDGSTTETFIFTIGQPGIATQYIGGVLQAIGIITSLPIQSVSSMTVNGDTQTTVEFGSFDGQTSSGPNDYLWFWTQGGSEMNWEDGPVPDGSVVIVTYIPGNASGTQQSSVVVGTAISPTAPSGAKLGTCGSGIFEVADQVQNVSLISDLNNIAADILARSGDIPIILTFETDEPGLAVGQQLSVVLPSMGLGTVLAPASLVVSQIIATAQTGVLAYGSWFRNTVTAINNYDASNWVTYFSRLIQRTENPLPVLQYETAKFILGAGSSLSSGNSLTNPYPVQRTGLFVQMSIAASVPPVDQNLVVVLTRNNVAVAQIVMPAGTAANTLILFPVPAANQLYFFANDILNVNVSYQLTGSSPVNASGVTLSAYWSM